MNSANFRGEVILGIEESEKKKAIEIENLKKIKKEAMDFYFKNILVFENEIVKNIPEVVNLTEKILSFIKSRFIESKGQPFILKTYDDILVGEREVVVKKRVDVRQPNTLLRTFGVRKYKMEDEIIREEIEFITDILNENKDYLYSLYVYLLEEYGIVMNYDIIGYRNKPVMRFSDIEVYKPDANIEKFTLAWDEYSRIVHLAFSFKPPLYNEDISECTLSDYKEYKEYEKINIKED